MNTFLKLRFGGRVWLKLRFVQRFPNELDAPAANPD